MLPKQLSNLFWLMRCWNNQSNFKLKTRNDDVLFMSKKCDCGARLARSTWEQKLFNESCGGWDLLINQRPAPSGPVMNGRPILGASCLHPVITGIGPSWPLWPRAPNKLREEEEDEWINLQFPEFFSSLRGHDLIITKELMVNRPILVVVRSFFF